jgi:alpha-tubulin suppressor-like RCC1 family protein
VSTSIGSATVSFEPPADTGDAPVTAFVVTAIDESTGESVGAVGSSSPITVSPGGGTFKFRAQAVNGFGPGRLTEFATGNEIYSGAELYSWGSGNYGQLGDGTTANKSSPVQIGALGGWAQVSAGQNHNAAITTDGELYSWGSGNYGQLGDGTATNKSSPVQIGALTNWAQVGAGVSHTASVKTEGTLWAWGLNNQGRLGNGATFSLSSPVQIGALTNWAQVSAGNTHTASIKTAGTLWAWGDNTYGQLGDGTTSPKSSPVQIGTLTNWAQVSAGGNSTVAVTTNGQLYAWGRNNRGQLGDGTTTQRNSPVQIGALTNWAQVSAGKVDYSGHTASVKTDGTLWAWGGNIVGQLGDGTTTQRNSPVQIGTLTNWAQVSAGKTSFPHTVSVKTDGTLWAWGSNGSGRLGDGTTTQRNSPVLIGALTNWVQASAGGAHTTALLGVL